MGHEVLFIEDSEEYAACYDPNTFQMTTDPSYGLSFIKSIFSSYELDGNWAAKNESLPDRDQKFKALDRSP